MVTKVSKTMLETKVVVDTALNGDTITFTYTDGTTQQLNIGSIPAIAQVATLVSQVAAINAYMASHP